MSKAETRSKEATKTAETDVPRRTVGIMFAAVFYIAAGLYYIIFPTVTLDLGALFLYAIGVVSVLAGYLLLKMHWAGLWLGLLLFPIHIVTPVYATGFNAAAALTSPLDALFLASLVILIAFASVTFLVLLDQRGNFRQPASLLTGTTLASKK